MKALAEILVLVLFLAASYLFFGIAIDNGFWHGDDFIALEHSLLMLEQKGDLFDIAPPFKFQPLVYGIYYLLFKQFAFDPRGYFIFNILLHGFNSFLVYLLVNILLRDRTVAILSGLLFVFTVGSYGKSIMIVSGVEDLVITALTLLTMIFYFKNDLYHGGRIGSPWFLTALLFFIAAMLTRTTSFSILGAFLAFNYFFRTEKRKQILSSDYLIIAAVAFAAFALKLGIFHYRPSFYTRYPGPLLYVYLALKNVFNYLVRMIFPIHTSHLVTEAGTFVRFVYRFATEIRILLLLTVISYSIFGFIFGNRVIRFFISWTYIMVLPFAFFQFPDDWLNIRHLYLVSVGFVAIISAGAVYCSRLISHQRYRRFVPLLVPLLFTIMARFIIIQLDGSYESKPLEPRAVFLREEIVSKHPSVEIEGTGLRLKD